MRSTTVAEYVPTDEARGGERPLVARELLALQLFARGYRPRQIRVLLHLDQSARAEELLRRVARTLGTAEVEEAVQEARRRGLIV